MYRDRAYQQNAWQSPAVLILGRGHHGNLGSYHHLGVQKELYNLLEAEDTGVQGELSPIISFQRELIFQLHPYMKLSARLVPRTFVRSRGRQIQILGEGWRLCYRIGSSGPMGRQQILASCIIGQHLHWRMMQFPGDTAIRPATLRNNLGPRWAWKGQWMSDAIIQAIILIIVIDFLVNDENICIHLIIYNYKSVLFTSKSAFSLPITS